MKEYGPLVDHFLFDSEAPPNATLPGATPAPSIGK
jgi:hypothetical protein